MISFSLLVSDCRGPLGGTSSFLATRRVQREESEMTQVQFTHWKSRCFDSLVQWPFWTLSSGMFVVMLVAAFLQKLWKWPAVIESRQIKTSCRTRKLHHGCCTKSCSFKVQQSSTQYTDARTGESALTSRSEMSLMLMSPRLRCYRALVACLFINIKRVTCPIPTKFDKAFPWASYNTHNNNNNLVLYRAFHSTQRRFT